MNFTLRVWRQPGPGQPGKFEILQAREIPPAASLLEMLDLVNNQLEAAGREPIAFEHDCREGICGSCGIQIDGLPHGPGDGLTTCQLYMRSFRDGATLTLEPWRAKAFPVLRDLIVDRSAFDRVLMAGGYISANAGSAPDANALPVPKERAELAMDLAQCIGCGACVAACKNASAMLFAGAKFSHLGLLPQGLPEDRRRVRTLVEAMDREGFGNCSNEGECAARCPKKIDLSSIARLNRRYFLARLFYGTT